MARKTDTEKAALRRQVIEVLRDPLTCHHSNAQIARFVGVSVALVRECREQASREGTPYMMGILDELKLSSLRLDGGTQSRSELDESLIEDYAEDARAGASFLRIGVIYDGTDYWVWDGFHRVHAFKLAGRKTIDAEIRQGDRRDAVLLSLSANSDHGLRRSNADTRRAVERALSDEEWSGWSDREIARRCAVTQPFVSKLRAEHRRGDNGYHSEQGIASTGGDRKSKASHDAFDGA